MNLLAVFRRSTRHVTAARRPRRGPDWVDAATAAPRLPEDDAATAAPGSWFDSSWVLRAGVSVTEHPAADLLALASADGSSAPAAVRPMRDTARRNARAA